jgi:hypothetical protein
MNGVNTPPLLTLVRPDIFIPDDAIGTSSTSTRLAHLQLMALQCLLGSTQFAVSCMEACCLSRSHGQLLSLFYSQMLIGASATSAMQFFSHE